MCSVPCTLDDIDTSNTLFAKSIQDAIDSDDMLLEVKSTYDSKDNNIINFNKHNIYST
jgi:hypothetical protein